MVPDDPNYYQDVCPLMGRACAICVLFFKGMVTVML